MSNEITIREIDTDHLGKLIYCIRGTRVMLDMDLADIYGYSTKDFNRQVKNNIEKFDQDFMFQLTDEEYENLRCKNSTSSWGGRRYNPYAFIVSLQKNTMKLKSSAVIWQGVKIRRQHAIFCLFSVLFSCLPR